jgi:hypothetical protein
MPKKARPKKAMSNEARPKEARPRKARPKRAMSNEARPKQATSKNKRHFGNCSALGADLWRMICMHLYDSPQALFRVVDILKLEPDWSQLLGRAMAHQNRLPHSNYASHLHSLTSYCYHYYDNTTTISDLSSSRRPETRCFKTAHAEPRISQTKAEAILRSVFSASCSVCGARQGHKLLRPFALRVCGDCLQKNTISNVALAIRYDIHFCDFLVSGEVPTLLLPIDVSANISRLSKDPCDFALADPQSVIFLWKQDYQVSERVAEQRRLAAKLLWASLRRAKQQLDLRRRRLLLLGYFDGGAAYNRLASSSCSFIENKKRLLFGGPYHHCGVLREAYYKTKDSHAQILRVMDILRCTYSLLKKEEVYKTTKRKQWFPSLLLPLAPCI